MLSRKYIQESEKEYEYMISELKEKVRFFTNESQRLEKENKKLKEQLERSEKARKEAIEYLNNSTMVASSYYHQRQCLLDILDIEKEGDI